METVEVVIRISKKDLETINDPKGKGEMQDNMESYKRVIQIADRIFLAIEKCTVLPKGHGRLIDADAINIHDVSPTYGMEVYGVTQDDIEYEPTIIEADKSDKEVEND